MMQRTTQAGLLGLSLMLGAPLALGQDAPTQAQIDEAKAALEAAQQAAADAQAALDALTAQAEAANAPAEPEVDLDSPEGFLKGWQSRFELGLNGSEGNTEKASLYVSVVSSRETTKNRQQFDASYIYGSSDGEQDDGKGTVGFRNDWLFEDKPYFLFADGRGDYDRFQDWEYRLQAFLGTGYELLKEDNYTFSPLLGIGATREFNSPNEEIRPEGLVGFDFAWAITPNQDFTYQFRAFPDLDDFGQYRMTNDIAWVINLPDMDNSNLSLGLKHEYDSHAQAPTKENDLFYYAAIGFDF